MSNALGSAVTNTNSSSSVSLHSNRLHKPWVITENLVRFTAQWEKFEQHLYDHDGSGHGGNTTIGYGHLVHRGPINHSASETPWHAGITEPDALKLLRNDLKVAEHIINQEIHVPLFQYEYDALVDFVYNVRGHSRESLLHLVNSGHYDRVPAKFMRYTSAGGSHPRGLASRRHSEAKLFKEGTYNAHH